MRKDKLGEQNRSPINSFIYLKEDVMRTFQHRRIKRTPNYLFNKSVLHNIG